MATRRREALILVTAGVAAAAAGFVAGPIFLGDSGPKSAAALLSARFPDLAGRPRQLSEWRGRVVVCNFWATWCAPCREEMPLLLSARAKYASKGVEIVGIAVDNAAKVREFSTALGITYPILLAEADGLELMRNLGNAAGGLPYTVFLDREGRPVEHKLGALKAAELDRILTEMSAG